MENKKLTPQIDAMKTAYLTGKKVSDVEVALASLSVIDEYRCHPYPTPPKEVTDAYLSKPFEVKQKMNRSHENYQPFWTDPKVKEYFDQRLKIKNINQRNKAWLEWMKEVLPDQELAIRMKLHHFEDAPIPDQPNWND